MSCHRMPGGGIVTLADIYHYKGFTFQWHGYLGPFKCRRDGEPSKTKEGDRFYDTVAEWSHPPKRKREQFRIK